MNICSSVHTTWNAVGMRVPAIWVGANFNRKSGVELVYRRMNHKNISWWVPKYSCESI